MYTTCLLIALAGVAAPTQGSEGLAWRSDYGQAKTEGAAEKKPLLVVVASGKDGWNKLARNGALAKESQELLAANYICVYVDAATPEGQRLARAFDLPSGLGVVISDATGKLMAFHHEGNLEEAALNQYLKRYSDASRVVTTTESNPTTVRRSSYYQQPAQPAIQVAPATIPTFTPSSYCPSCSRR